MTVTRQNRYLMPVAAVAAVLWSGLLAHGGLATLRVTNEGRIAVKVNAVSIQPYGTARIEVASGIPGELDVDLPDGYGLKKRPTYPALDDGAMYSVRLDPFPMGEGRSRQVSGPSVPAKVEPPPENPQLGKPFSRDVPPPSSAGQEDAAGRAPVKPAGHTAPPARPAAAGRGKNWETEINLPVLWVRGDGGGGCSRLSFSLRRTGSGKSLRISTSDDTPGGAGEDIRASLWQAATTAALLLGDPLDGVRIECEYSGSVDGPSAGGVTCLAILTALSGRTFPDDFAMTGTIMSDGTVGLVGGVAKKMRGAKQAGIRRVCIPAFERFEEQDDGEVVDLHALARELGLELHPVSNVGEAFAFAHRQPYPNTPTVPDAALYRDTAEMETAFFEGIIANMRRAREARKRVEEEVEEEDEMSASALRQMGEVRALPKVDVAFRAGMLHVALLLSAENYAYWCGHAPLRRRLGLISNYDLSSVSGYRRWSGDADNARSRAARQIASIENAWHDDAGAGGRFSPLAAQCVPVNLLSELDNGILRAPVPNLLPADIGDDNVKDGKENMAFRNLMRREALSVWYDAFAESYDTSWRRAAAILPSRRPVGNPKVVEEFFHAARVAQDNAIDGQFKEVLPALIENNFDASLYLLKRKEAEGYHFSAAKLAEAESPLAQFAQVLSIMAQIDTLAHGSMVATLFGNEIGVTVDDDGDYGYSNIPYVSYVIRAARAQAVKAISACSAGNVPCPRVRAHFERADYYRDADSFDRFDVLREYWCATLKAKALLMLFADNPGGNWPKEEQ